MLDENIRISDIGVKPDNKISVTPMYGFEVKKKGVTVEFMSINAVQFKTDPLRGVEVFKLDGDKKWKI